jgi:DTW domain-containing protein
MPRVRPPRSRVPDLTKRCPRCLFLPEVCLCPAIPRVEARTRFVVVRHASERNRPTNTARWAALALGCEVLDYGGRDGSFDAAALDQPGTWVLFPSPAPAPAGAEPPRRVVVLDGSWSQARRMIQRLPALQRLPRLALRGVVTPPDADGLPRLRRPTIEHGMSTIEAMARALAQLGEARAAVQLDAVHAAALERAWSLRGDPRRAGPAPSAG